MASRPNTCKPNSKSLAIEDLEWRKGCVTHAIYPQQEDKLPERELSLPWDRVWHHMAIRLPG